MKQESSSTIKLLTTSFKEDSSHPVAMLEDGDRRKSELLVDAIYEEVNGRVERAQIRRLLLEAHAKYQEVPVKTYLPILIRRYVLEKLR